jgi:hypothetical protein
MDVAHQFLEVWLLLADDGFVTILKKGAVPMVSTIKAHHISCQ